MDDMSNSILVVEDDADTRAGLVGFLESEGFTVLAAENGRQALDLLERSCSAPRLILLDLMMPVMDGWQFLAARPKSGARSSVVLLSGLTFIEGATDVADFIRKPIDLGVLRTCVRRFCGSPAKPTA